MARFDISEINGQQLLDWDFKVDMIYKATNNYMPKCHSFTVTNTGNTIVLFNDMKLSPGDARSFYPPAINLICAARCIIKFDETGVLTPVNELEITKILINHPCFEAQNKTF